MSLSLDSGDARQAMAILTMASVLWLAAAGYAATVADGGRPETDPVANAVAAVVPLRDISAASMGQGPTETLRP